MLPPVNVINCEAANYLLFNTNDAISTILYKTGQWNDHLLHLSSSFVQGIEAPIIIDIGANVGAYSIPLAKYIQPMGGMVYGFEPQRIVYYQLCGNIVLNRLDNYEAFNYAVGEENRPVELPFVNYNKNHNIGAFSIDRDIRKAKNTEQYMNYERIYVVPMVTLDTLQLPRAPSLIKIDAEGYELNILKGARQFLETHRFPPILFEAWKEKWFAKQKAALLKFCAKLGYQISFQMAEEYVIQHPGNPVHIDFVVDANNVVSMTRSR